MNFRKIIIELYPSVIKRVNGWVIPLMLVLLYLSGYLASAELVLVYLTRIGLKTMHAISGFILIFSMAVLVYDKAFTYFSSNQPEAPNPEAVQSIYRSTVDVVFYNILAIISFLGFLLYFMKAFSWSPFFLDQTNAFMLHVIIGSFFLAIIPIKYYLSLIMWYRELMTYLREE